MKGNDMNEGQIKTTVWTINKTLTDRYGDRWRECFPESVRRALVDCEVLMVLVAQEGHQFQAAQELVEQLFEALPIAQPDERTEALQGGIDVLWQSLIGIRDRLNEGLETCDHYQSEDWVIVINEALDHLPPGLQGGEE